MLQTEGRQMRVFSKDGLKMGDTGREIKINAAQKEQFGVDPDADADPRIRTFD